MKHLGVFLLPVFWLCSPLWGFVPPLSAVFKANFDSRKSGFQETFLRHQILLKSGETLALEERFAKLNGKIYTVFKSPLYGEFSAVWTKAGYLFSAERKIPSRSVAFMTYFTTSQPDVFREVLIDEKMIKRDQFSQYKPSFVPEGDPAQWNLNDNYLIQPHLFFARTPFGPSIIAVGLEEGSNRRAVFFEKDSLILSRIEWKNDKEVTSWNFGNPQKLPQDGVFPREMFFQVEDKEIVKTSLVSRNALEERSKKQWLAKHASSSKGSLNPTVEEALKILLSYR